MPSFLFLLSRHREVYPLHIREVLLVVVLVDVLHPVGAVQMFFFCCLTRSISLVMSDVSRTFFVPLLYEQRQ